MRYGNLLFFFLALALNGFTQQGEGFIKIRDGNLFYVVKGSGPPMVFLHGLCLDHRMWENQVNYFSRFYTCILPDLRGFGKSSVPTTSPYSFHEDIHTLLDSLHIQEPVVLMALSMGGKAAVNFALAYPGKTKAMILADVVVDGYRFNDFTLSPIYEAGRLKGIDSANQMFLSHPIFNSARNDSSVFPLLTKMILSYSGWQWVNKNPVQGLTPPAIEQLEKINVPVLIITGEKDIHDFQVMAGFLHEKIKHSIKRKITGAGHMCNMEKPGDFNTLSENFLIKIKTKSK
jgi:pimeloyl-ACP methyl ester carboxylesterase